MSQTLYRLPWLTAALIAAGAAQAQDFEELRLGSAIREGGRAGAALIVGHAYKGSDESRTSLLPTVEYRWASGWFAGIGSGVGYEILRNDGTNAGVRLTPDFGRKESRSPALAGMGDVSAGLEIGMYVNHALRSLGLGLHASTRYGGDKGLVGDVSVAHGMQLAQALRLRLGVALTVADSKHMQTYFGVSEAQVASTQAAGNGYSRYQASAGVRDTRLSAGLLYVLAKDWALTGSLTATTLHGDAANSPLTRQRTSLTLLAGVGYRF